MPGRAGGTTSSSRTWSSSSRDEALGDDGARELILTNLDEYGMPLIRYRIGDLAVPAEGRCACGRHWGMLAAVHGRRSDLIETPSGGALLAPDFFSGLLNREFPTLVQYQVARTEHDKLEMRVVGRPPFDDATLRRMEAVVRPILGEEWRFVVVAHDSLPLTRAGKHLFVVDETLREASSGAGSRHTVSAPRGGAAKVIDGWRSAVDLGGHLQALVYDALTGAESLARRSPISRELRFLRRAQWWDPEETRRLRDARVERLVRHAYETTAFYRRRMDDAGVLPRHVTRVADVARLPLLTRKDVAETRGRDGLDRVPPFGARGREFQRIHGRARTLLARQGVPRGRLRGRALGLGDGRLARGRPLRARMGSPVHRRGGMDPPRPSREEHALPGASHPDVRPIGTAPPPTRRSSELERLSRLCGSAAMRTPSPSSRSTRCRRRAHLPRLPRRASHRGSRPPPRRAR